MDTVKKAKAYVKNMKATDSTTEHHKLIVALLLEVKCLKVQVQDRGNSYQKLTTENAELNRQLAKSRMLLESSEQLRKAAEGEGRMDIKSTKEVWNGLPSYDKLTFEESVALTEMVDNLISEYARLTSLCANYREALADTLDPLQHRVACQKRLMDKCMCHECITERIHAALQAEKEGKL